MPYFKRFSLRGDIYLKRTEDEWRRIIISSHSFSLILGLYFFTEESFLLGGGPEVVNDLWYHTCTGKIRVFVSTFFCHPPKLDLLDPLAGLPDHLAGLQTLWLAAKTLQLAS